MRRCGYYSSDLRGLRFAFQLFGLVVGDERVNDGLQAALHHEVELVQSEADAMVGDSILRKVVGADLFATIA